MWASGSDSYNWEYHNAQHTSPLARYPGKFLSVFTDDFVQMKHSILLEEKGAGTVSCWAWCEKREKSPLYPDCQHKPKGIFFSLTFSGRGEKAENFAVQLSSLDLLPFSVLAYFSLFLSVRVPNAAFAQCLMLSCCAEHAFLQTLYQRAETSEVLLGQMYAKAHSSHEKSWYLSTLAQRIK